MFTDNYASLFSVYSRLKSICSFVYAFAISFHPDVSKITFREDGFGSFNFSLRLYHDDTYITPYLPADYPVHAKFGDKLYFEARTWSEPGLELFVQRCRATPTSNPDDFHRYTFIKDGWDMGSTWLWRSLMKLVPLYGKCEFYLWSQDRQMTTWPCVSPGNTGSVLKVLRRQ